MAEVIMVKIRKFTRVKLILCISHIIPLSWFLALFHIYLSDYAPIAQLVEQVPFKDKVPGPIPGGRTKFSALFYKYVLSLTQIAIELC